MGTILRYAYVLTSRHPVCAQPHRCLAPRQCAHRIFQLSYGPARAAGRFILRIEDTDVERSELRFRDALIAELRWLGLDWDEGPDIGGPHAPYTQAERGEFYRGLFARLEAEGRLYPCYCTAGRFGAVAQAAAHGGQAAALRRHLPQLEPRRARRARSARLEAHAALRRARGPVIEFVDSVVHGPQRFLSDDIGDFIVRREDGTSSFFFCNAVDDSVMGVTQVLRGDDHPDQYAAAADGARCVGMRRPGYGHVGSARRGGRRAAVEAPRQHERQ
jgi:nondiscriminating glutamyl-tRNA synthetase